MTDTPNLGLPLLAAAQSQKHVTVNEALVLLDAAVQLAVLDRTRATPPAAPGEGDRHIVASGAGGAWSGQDGRIAMRQDGGWRFVTPKSGWLAFVVGEGRVCAWEGAEWTPLDTPTLASLSALGIGTAVDAVNPLSVRANNALFAARPAAEGGDDGFRLKLNKVSAADTLSVLFQDGFSGRAEIGLVGSDDFLFKVSPDGTTWFEALRIDRASGRVSLPAHGAAQPFAHGRCVLRLSGGALVLKPFDGNGLIIDGICRAVPPAGVSLAATGLASATTYFIYAAWSGSAVVLEAATTVHVPDPSSGIEVKAGDPTRTLVGMARTITGPAWVDDAERRLVLSRFNRQDSALSAELAATATLTATGLTEISSSLRLEALCWEGDSGLVGASGTVTASAASGIACGCRLDGATIGHWSASMAAGAAACLSIGGLGGRLTEGYHVLTLAGSTSAGSATWSAGDGAATSGTRLWAAFIS